MKARERTTVLLLVCGALVMGCGSSESALGSGETIEASAVVAALRAQGIMLQDQGPITQPELIEPGREYLTSGGGSLQIFEYDSGSGAVLDSSKLRTEGRGFDRKPVVYRRKNVIVLYFGDNPAVDAALSTVLGPRLS